MASFAPAHKLNAQLSQFPMNVLNVADLAGHQPTFGQPNLLYDTYNTPLMPALRGPVAGIAGLPPGDILQRQPVLLARGALAVNPTLGDPVIWNHGLDGQIVLQDGTQAPLHILQFQQPVQQLQQLPPIQSMHQAHPQSHTRPQQQAQPPQQQLLPQQLQIQQQQQLQIQQQQLQQLQQRQQLPIQQQQPVQPIQLAPKQAVPQVSTPQTRSNPPQGRVSQLMPKPSTPAPKPQNASKKSGGGMAWDALKLQQAKKWKNKETAIQQQPEKQEDEFLETETKEDPTPVDTVDEQDQLTGKDADAGNSDKEEEDEELLVSSEDSEDLETDNLVVCTFENKSRVKNRWKVSLKSGVMTINGKDYLFNRATLEGEW